MHLLAPVVVVSLPSPHSVAVQPTTCARDPRLARDVQHPRVELRSRPFREALASRVVVADGAMGTMLQAQDPSMDDFQGHEGCNEILNVTRPDIVRAVHEAYFDAGVDAVETNTFGANLGQPGGVRHRGPRIEELAEAGARIAREAADDRSRRRTSRAG